MDRTCAYPGCPKGIDSGHALARISPKGEDFLGHCEDHFDGELMDVVKLIQDENLKNRP